MMSRTKAWVVAISLGATAGVGLVGTGSDPAVGATSHAVSQCRVADVAVSYHDDGAGMSHRFGRITLLNTSDRSCSVQGYGGLSYVGGGDGTQVGAPATREPSPTPRSVLDPGGRISSLVEAADTAPYSHADCRPTHVDGLRMYLPDETHAVFLSHPTTGCRNTSVHLLDHQAFRPGAQR